LKTFPQKNGKEKVEFTLFFFFKAFKKKSLFFGQKKLQNLLKKKHLGGTLPASTLTILF
jgi:hypothetical protein